MPPGSSWASSARRSCIATSSRRAFRTRTRTMALIVTGAAGFIGANLVKALNARGSRDIVAVDNLSRAGKVPNLADLEIADFLDKRDFLELVRGGLDGEFDAVIHQGACSDTMET